MLDMTPVHVLIGALLARLSGRVRGRGRGRGQTSLEWAVIAGGAVVGALAIAALLYTVLVGWGHHVQQAPAQ